jgi:hypothetical protein
VLKIKKHLSLQPLIDSFKAKFADIDTNDTRRQESVDYSKLDTSLAGLACMFYKSSDMVSFQERMQKKFYKNNLETQFGVSQIPKDNQMRTILGSIDTGAFAPVYKDYLNKLQRSKELSKFKFGDKYLVALDATQYYSSSKVNCSCCLTKTDKQGNITNYSHSALQPIICHPDQKQIFPMMPEDINNSDGTKKQDCEINAAKRLLPKIRSSHPKMDFVWLADSIYATTPFINSILEAKEDFIFRIKQGDHKHLYEHIKTTEHPSYRHISNKSTIVHHYYKDVPLNKSSNIKVNVIKAYSITQDKNGKQSSNLVGVWATNITLDDGNVYHVTRAARTRWKIENECFNALKNSGYELTHNWGHVKGESFAIYNLIMLAFYIHQILELTDYLFKKCREISRTYKNLWSDLTYHFKYYLFESWENMLCFHLERNEYPPPQIV